MAGEKQSLRIFDFHGSPDNYLVFKNCGGQVTLKNTGGSYGINVQGSKYFRLTGTGDPGYDYGFKVIQAGGLGVTLGAFSTNFEVDHVEVGNVGSIGIVSKTDPGCASPDLRYFVQQNTYFHDNYIHDTGTEGFYVGYTGYPTKTIDCNGQPTTLYPHEIHEVAIYDNIVKNTKWDGIQMGCATSGASIHGNVIEGYGLVNNSAQNNGVHCNPGTAADVHDNWIKSGSGNGIGMFGLGGNTVYNNIIIDPGASGIFCDDRYTIPGKGFVFINNTIIRPGTNGMRMYSDESTGNVFLNNIVAAPSAAYVYLLNSSIDWTESNNRFAPTVAEVHFIDAVNDDYHLSPDSPACGAGMDVSSYGIVSDFDGQPRGAPFDVGAYVCSNDTIFSQGFDGCASIICYVSASPDDGQLDDISSETTGGVWAVSGGRLQIARASSSAADNGAGFTRFTDLAGPPSVLHVTLDLGVSNFNSFQNDALILDIGRIGAFSDYNNSSVNADTFARLSIDGSGSNTFKFEMGGVQSAAFSANGTMYAISYFLNKSGAAQAYQAPDGTTRTLSSARASLWVGTALIFNDVVVMNGASSALTDFRARFAHSDGGTWMFDNLVIRDALP
jgi:hypothetical protein